jgi:hypothetical protein
MQDDYILLAVDKDMEKMMYCFGKGIVRIWEVTRDGQDGNRHLQRVFP